ncbi:UpxY family transcription antiterminator [Pontibacter locisalis]|uniref:UpxY family transcription antiterminator n=1 Tax=Pontibacter locisalis TaxID=1719035 RepID=A0ABW5IM64_9BACT
MAKPYLLAFNTLDNMEEKNWYAIYTKPRWEKKVAGMLSQAGIENYCPTTKVVRQWSDRKKTIIEPLFKSYVFVKVAEKQKWEVRSVPGVLNYVYHLGKPAAIKQEEINAVADFLKEHESVSVQEISLNAGDVVKVRSLPFSDLEGEVVAVRGNEAILQITSMGLALVAISKRNLQLVKTLQTN